MEFRVWAFQIRTSSDLVFIRQYILYSQIVSVEAKGVNEMAVILLLLAFISEKTLRWIFSATVMMMLSKLYILYS